MKAYTKYKEEIKMKKATKCLLGGAFASNKTLIIDGVSYTFDYGGTLINNVP